ncbi:hypothetical protein F5X99DRAFT_104590 [Biscogniauxia marginata]|nr:hypothetical protein F5X99DRAFT_104590 [Biscogniauxia marginata]
MERTHKPHHKETAPLPYPLESTIPTRSSHDWSVRSYESKSGSELRAGSLEDFEDPCSSLRHFNTMLFIDDSVHMRQHWEEVESLIKVIGPICTKYDPNGIDIEFIHHRPRSSFLTGKTGYTHIGFATGNPDIPDNVEGIFGRVGPKGKCKMDRRLSPILDTYLSEYDLNLRRTGRRIMPLNVIIITSGVTDDNPYHTLVRTARELDKFDAPPYQVGIQFFQVGKEPDATWALASIDDELSREENVRDIVDTVTWTGKPGELSPAALLKVLLGAVKRSIDEMAV